MLIPCLFLQAPKGLNHPSLLRMRVMMKTAGDKIAADLKSLKVKSKQRTPLHQNTIATLFFQSDRDQAFSV